MKYSPSITLMRSTKEESEKLGEVPSKRLRNCKDSRKVEMWVPLRGVSMIAEKGVNSTTRRIRRCLMHL